MTKLRWLAPFLIILSCSQDKLLRQIGSLNEQVRILNEQTRLLWSTTQCPQDVRKFLAKCTSTSCGTDDQIKYGSLAFKAMIRLKHAPLYFSREFNLKILAICG